LFGEFPLVVLEDANGDKLLNAVQFTLAMENAAVGDSLNAAHKIVFDMCDPEATEDIFHKCMLSGFDDIRPVDHGCRFSCAKLNKLLRIYSANAHKISTADLDGSENGKNGIFPMTALMNHSCAPNCGFSCGDTFATGKIAKNEELTISYLSTEDLTLPLGNRRKVLLEAFHFQCICSRCLSEDNKRMPSKEPPAKKMKGSRGS
jgi:hypothetical protein